jgi:hypothetical protein
VKVTQEAWELVALLSVSVCKRHRTGLETQDGFVSTGQVQLYCTGVLDYKEAIIPLGLVPYSNLAPLQKPAAYCSIVRY